MKAKVFLLAVFSLFCQLCLGSDPIKFSILGDSYSTFKGYLQPSTNLCWYGNNSQAHNDVTKVDEMWWMKLIKKMDGLLEYNNSYSGATVCHSGSNGADLSDRSFVSRIHNLGHPDVILIFGGTNDSWCGVPLGDFQYHKWVHEDLFLFRPAFSYLLGRLKELYPDALICNITNCDISKEIIDSMKEICNHYKVLNVQLEQIDKQSGHPSVKGMQQIYTQVYNQLK